MRGILVVFLVNGLLHEYLATVILGRVQGYQLAFFSIQGIAVALTFRSRPRGLVRVGTCFATLLLDVVTTTLFFASVDAIFR